MPERKGQKNAGRAGARYRRGMAKPTPPTAKRVSPRSGLVKLTVSVRPEQYQALLTEARRRADAAARFKLDASELVREALDVWMAKRRGGG